MDKIIRDFVTPSDILVAMAHYMAEDNIIGFKKNEVDQWFHAHRDEMPMVELHFRDRGFGPYSDEIHLSISNLMMSKLVYFKSNDDDHLFFEKVPNYYRRDVGPLLERMGLTMEQQKQLAESFKHDLTIDPSEVG